MLSARRRMAPWRLGLGTTQHAKRLIEIYAAETEIDPEEVVTQNLWVTTSCPTHATSTSRHSGSRNPN